jgi:TRAP-type mannitol/chloroaromatic compound transport system substrate-binding protein
LPPHRAGYLPPRIAWCSSAAFRAIWSEQAHHLAGAAYHSFSASFFINLEKWNELPKHYKIIAQAAASHATIDMQAKYDARNPAALRRLVAVGTQLRPLQH